ncbi:type III secretion system inner rod subunit SctI [Sodalis sp. RH21]|uniref:type III secretion system inner rod subunit SctI n=1 Tax=unclassified Sodalis (in: enterobacteria) TaxID=2636512 RepID=UPI0039B61262
MTIERIAEISASRIADIRQDPRDIESISSIAQQSMAATAVNVARQKQDIAGLLASPDLSHPATLGRLQTGMLTYSNAVTFIGTGMRKIVGAVETLLRS